MSGASDLDRPRRAPASSGLEVDGRPALLDRSTGSLHVLNDVGAAIWSRLDGSYTVGSLVAELSEEFGAEPARVAHDVQGFLSSLERMGLLEGSAAARQRGASAHLARTATRGASTAHGSIGIRARSSMPFVRRG